jgi:hypothetical protein
VKNPTIHNRGVFIGRWVKVKSQDQNFGRLLTKHGDAPGVLTPRRFSIAIDARCEVCAAYGYGPAPQLQSSR